MLISGNWIDYVGRRGSVDGTGAPAVSNGAAEGGERRLAGNFSKLCQDSNPDSGGESCSEVLPPAEQPEPPASSLQPL